MEDSLNQAADKPTSRAMEVRSEDFWQMRDELNQVKEELKKSKEQQGRRPDEEQPDERRRRGFVRREPPTCYLCGHKGHVQRWCPFEDPKKEGRKDEQKQPSQKGYG